MKRAAVLALVLVAACSGGSKKAAPPPTEAPTSTPTAVATTAPPTAAPTSAPPKADDGPSGGPVPRGFKPISVTFVSTQSGWALGDATCSKPPCTSIVRTRDGGKTWKGIPAPVAAINGEGGPSINQVRFGDLLNGFAFSDSLYTTHDGGAHWTLLPVSGSVVSLEIGHGLWWAVVQGCSTAVDTCTKEGRVLRGTVGSDKTTDVMDLPSVVTGQVVLHGAAVYLSLFRQDQESSAPAVVESPNGTTTFAKRDMPCNDTEVPYLATTSDTRLSLVCQTTDAGAGQQGKRFFTSTSSGRAWSAHAPPAQIVSTTIAATAAATFVGNSRTGVEVTRDGGRSWQQSLSTDAGVNYVGFAGASFGEAITGEGLQLTYDAGKTWAKVAF